MSREQIIEREARWATPAALISIGAVILYAVSQVMLASSYGSEGDADLLRKVDEDSGTLVLAYAIRSLGFVLLAIPLLYLFRSAQARNPGMRRQLIGLCIAGPVFLAGFSLFTGLSIKDAAPDFVSVAKSMHALGNTDHADKVAQDVVADTSTSKFVGGFYIAGAVSFAIAMAYGCFHAMRVGLLTRFWGSLGAALGVVSIIPNFAPFTLLFIAYLGLLIGGWTPRGRPPGWAAGEAVPWPTPGERAAEQLQPGDSSEAGEAEPSEAGDVTEPVNPPRRPGERRKRKRRS